MPRSPRLDRPDVLHQVMVRELASLVIFTGDTNRVNFVSRLAVFARWNKR